MLRRTAHIFLVLLLISTTISSQETKKLKFNTLENTTLEFMIFGQGKPTLIFENGMGSKIETWNSIPNSLSKNNQVFLYNRAGIGKSKLSQQQRTIPNMVNELRALLKKEKIKPPYIYVAHSMGTYLARYFAANYPNEIQGLLLIDPSPDKMYDDYTDKEYEEFKKIGDDSFANASQGEKLEWQNYLENRKYVRDISISDKIPMVIISATQWNFSKYHKKMLNSHILSKNIIAKGSHNIHGEKPELIIKLVLELLNNTK